ncbi:MAG: pyridoxal phosphate-dependent aminotransferase [Polyangiaceae bacterium]|nr:pyridoxal phosphate-dependent aminotransferase [Polyangiaceae bacterium]
MARGVAARLDRVPASATLAMNARVEELRAAGKPILDFGVGEADFEPPAAVLEAARDALHHANHYAPVAGTDELRSVIAQTSERDRGFAAKASQVVVSFGAKQALFNSLMMLLDPGDEVLVPAPYWVSHPAQVELLGGVPRVIHARKEDGWKIRPEALERSISPRSKALILCSPANPTGATYSSEELSDLAGVLKAHDLYVLSAEGYHAFTYSKPHASIVNAAPELAERTLIIDGISKTYGLAGWRVGWTIAPKRLARSLEKIQSQSTSGVSVVAQAVAACALSGSQSVVEAARSAYEATRKVLASGLDAIDGISCSVPEGGIYVLPEISGLYGIQHQGRELASARDVALWLLDTAHVVCIDGDAFGAPNHVRFTQTTDSARIQRALEAIRAAVAGARRDP